MASPRITKDMRENIVDNAIDHTFKAQKDAFMKEEYALAEKAYKEQYTPAQIKAMETLGDNFVEQSCVIKLNLNGLRRQLRFSERHFVEGQQYHNPLVPSDKLLAKIDDFLTREGEFDKKLTTARINLTAMLESVMSFKKLRAVWPEGEKFYDMYDVDSEKPGVPAVVVTEINKLFGL